MYVNGYAIGVTRAHGCRKRKRPVRVYLQIVAAIVAQGEATPDKAGDCAPHGMGTANRATTAAAATAAATATAIATAATAGAKRHQQEPREGKVKDAAQSCFHTSPLLKTPWSRTGPAAPPLSPTYDQFLAAASTPTAVAGSRGSTPFAARSRLRQPSVPPHGLRVTYC